MYFALKCSVGYSVFRTAFALISPRSPPSFRASRSDARKMRPDLSSTVFMNTQSFLHHAADRFRLHVRRPSIAHWNTNTYTILSIFRPPPVPDHRAQRGEENFRVARRSVGISLFRARVRGLFPYFGAACRNTIISPACIGGCKRRTFTPLRVGENRWFPPPLAP